MEHTHSRLLNPSGVKFPQVESQDPPQLLYDLSNEAYHADRTAISSTGIRKVLRSPKHYLSWLLGMEEEEEEKDHFRFGYAAHVMLLEPAKFRKLYVVQPDFGAMQSKANREKRDKWREDQAPDAIILTEDEMAHLNGMIESVTAHPIARNLLVEGRPEVSGFFNDPETGVRCKVRPDYLSVDPTGDTHLIDLKTTRDVRKGMFSDAVHRYRYDLQIALYTDGIAAITGRPPMTSNFLAVEKTPPYECAVYSADDQMLAHGRQWYQHGLRLLKKCIKGNEWPGVSANAEMISLPRRAEFDQFPEFVFDGGGG